MNIPMAELRMEGDVSLLEGRRRALLISRTPRRPSPDTPWVRAVSEAARATAKAGEILVTGIGRAPYDVALASCRRAGGSAIVALDAPPDANDSAWRAYAEGLLPERRLIVGPRQRVSSGKGARATALRNRDLLMAAVADRAWAVHVRAGGNMAAAADALRARGCLVEEWTNTQEIGDAASEAAWRAPSASPAEPIPVPQALLPNLRAPQATEAWPFLTHYTREPDGAWPDEPPAAYADWLAHGPLGEHRDAACALERILKTGVILGSTRLMPAREPMASFTARPPWELGELLRWRRGLQRWTFRPYGLAVRREALERLGAQPVRYVTERERRAMETQEILFTQKHDPPRTDWSAEREWRVRGDVRLDALPRDAFEVFVPTAAEAERLRAAWGVAARAIRE